jgi:hypothetical protein
LPSAVERFVNRDQVAPVDLAPVALLHGHGEIISNATPGKLRFVTLWGGPGLGRGPPREIESPLTQLGACAHARPGPPSHPPRLDGVDVTPEKRQNDRISLESASACLRLRHRDPAWLRALRPFP